jgi:hypothetical protein
MGIITGTFGLIVGLFFLLLASVAIKLPTGRWGWTLLKKEEGKLKFDPHTRPSWEQALGRQKALLFFRIFGSVILILSIFAFISPDAP